MEEPRLRRRGTLVPARVAGAKREYVVARNSSPYQVILTRAFLRRDYGIAIICCTAGVHMRKVFPFVNQGAFQ